MKAGILVEGASILEVDQHLWTTSSAFTCTNVRLMTGAGDFCSEVQVVLLPFFWGSVLCAKGYHASREASQMAHFVIHDASSPLCNVG